MQYDFKPQAGDKGSMSAFKRFLYKSVPMTASDWLVDFVIAAGAFGLALLQLSLSASLFVPDHFTRMILGIRTVGVTQPEALITALMCLPLMLRRRFPWPVFAFTVVVWTISEFVYFFDVSLVSILVALFTLFYECRRSEGVIASIVTLTMVLIAAGLNFGSRLTGILLLQNIMLIAAVAFGGYALNVRQEYVEEAKARINEAERLRESEAERAREAERTRESEAKRRVEEERVNIAREIHDITAHSLSAVSIQAAAAERLIDSDPSAAKEAISQVRSTAKSSLEDMRAMVGVLRGEDLHDAETSPVEGTERIGDLVNYLEGAGIQCDLITDTYDRSMVPSHIDVALFGIAREACTNIVRHSDAKHARIALATVGPETKVGDKKVYVTDKPRAYLTVSDDGKGYRYDDKRKGHGVEGMQERAQLLGGIFEILSVTVPGTIVQVSIPLDR